MWIIALVLVMAGIMFIGWRRSGRSLTHFLGLGLVYCYARLWHRWSSNGQAPVPATGPAILISNHTCSADPAFLTAGCPRILSFLLAHEFFHVAGLKSLFNYIACVPARRNGQDAVAARTCLQRLHAGRILCIFPEGDLSHAGLGRLGHPKAGAALVALRSRAPVIPAFISGGPQTVNILTAWLRPSHVHVTFGSPVDLTAYHDRPIDRPLIEEVAQLLMQSLRDLVHEVEPNARRSPFGSKLHNASRAESERPPAPANRS